MFYGSAGVPVPPLGGLHGCRKWPFQVLYYSSHPSHPHMYKEVSTLPHEDLCLILFNLVMSFTVDITGKSVFFFNEMKE